jgi:hypothetical protein
MLTFWDQLGTPRTLAYVTKNEMVKIFVQSHTRSHGPARQWTSQSRPQRQTSFIRSHTNGSNPDARQAYQCAHTKRTETGILPLDYYFITLRRSASAWVLGACTNDSSSLLLVSGRGSICRRLRANRFLFLTGWSADLYSGKAA